jgi:hypothetical protein
MPKVARAHHFVPEAMLAGFTPGGSKNEKLWVVDLRTKREWTTTPRNVAHRRDFYRVDAPGVTPDFVEQRMLAPVESDAIQIIRAIERTEQPPTDPSELRALLLFVALLATRGPLARFAVDEIVDAEFRHLVAKLTASDDQWNEVRRDMAESGIAKRDMSRDEMIDAVAHVRFNATQQFQLRIMFKAVNYILPELTRRTWSTVTSTSGSFICSDRPVALIFNTPPPWTTRPGFALKNTDVIVPLTKHIMLRGSFRDASRCGQTNRKGVGKLNSLTLNNAERYIFASSAEFPWTSGGPRLESGAENLPRKSEPVFHRLK